MIKLCECGCGNPAPIAKYTQKKYGHIKGQPTRFILGHSYKKMLTKEAQEKSRMSHIGFKHTLASRKLMSDIAKANGVKPSLETIIKAHLGKRIREKNNSWKGGITYTSGYLCRYNPDHPRSHPNGYVYEHILIVEKVLGRSLTLKEVVHHIDGNKLNNNPDNLQIMSSQSEHRKAHQKHLTSCVS